MPSASEVATNIADQTFPFSRVNHEVLAKLIYDAITDAVTVERDACAVIVHNWGDWRWRALQPHVGLLTVEVVAQLAHAAITARGTTPTQLAGGEKDEYKGNEML